MNNNDDINQREDTVGVDSDAQGNVTLDDVTIESYNDDLDDGEITSKDIAKKLRLQIKELQKEKQEYLDGWQRTKADFANYKKRETDERQEFTKFANEGLLNDLLGVLESFQLAFKNTDAWNKVEPNWRIGVEYIYQQLLRTVGEHGLTIEAPSGADFDPSTHQSVGSVETDDPAKEHKIAELVSPGFSLKGKMLKPPTVKVYEIKKQ